MPLVPCGAPSMRASTRWTMFSARSCSPAEMKILVPVMRVGAVAVRHGLGPEQAEIRAAMGLGQVHGAGPGARDHLRQVGLLLLLGAVHEERRDRALGQARIHAERQVRRGDEFLHDRVERRRAGPGRRYSSGAASPIQPPGGIGLVGLLEALRRGHRSVRVAGAALLVARQVERREHLLAELGALGRGSPRPCRASHRRSPAGCCSARSGTRRSEGT